MKKLKRTILLLLCIDAAVLLSCFVSSLHWILLLLTKIDIFEITLFNKIGEFFMIPFAASLLIFIFARCFFLPEIVFSIAVILQIVYFVRMTKSKQSDRRTAILCISLDIFCSVALLSAQMVFDNAMSV